MIALAELMVQHRGPLLADFRSLYNTPVATVAGAELFLLVKQLLSERRSWFAAAVAGWERPVTGSEVVLMDLYDRFVEVNFKKPHTPYPRPFDKKKTRIVKKRTAKEAMAILRPKREIDG